MGTYLERRAAGETQDDQCAGLLEFLLDAGFQLVARHVADVAEDVEVAVAQQFANAAR
jgi:hypothetical protein